MNRTDRDHWIKAVKDELKAHERCGTWKLVKSEKLPAYTPIIDSRWVNKIKVEADGTLRYRSRLVARGFADRNIYDRGEIYAPVARLGDVRFLLVVANYFNLELIQFDIRTAFLNGFLEKPVYMKIPEGIELLGTDYEMLSQEKNEWVCELQRALYGLKVSPLRWFIRFRTVMRQMGFSDYLLQPCLFTWREKEKFAILLLYVDDILLCTNSLSKMCEVENKLRSEFEITCLGEPKRFLGIEIERNRQAKTIKLHQGKFVRSIIERFGLSNAKSVNSPMLSCDAVRKVKDEEVDSNDGEVGEDERPQFRQAIGALLYLANGTRPDITYAVNILSRRQSVSTLSDWKQVKRVMRYLRGVPDLGLVFRGKGEGITCYPDASFGLNDPLGRSTSGFVIKLFGDTVMWRTKKQNHIALSSTEAEYVAMSLACRELSCLKEMCRNILKLGMIPILFEDNRAAINLAKTSESKSLKHLVNVLYHYVREKAHNGEIQIEWINTKDQIGDLFTKALAGPKFEEFRRIIMDNV
jgi:hypothetical protein